MTSGSILEILAWVGGVLVLLWVLRFVLLLQTFLRLRLRQPGFAAIAGAEVPRHLEGLLGPAAAELERLGFTRQGWLHQIALEDVGPDRSPALLLRHGDGAAFAVLAVAEPPCGRHPSRVTFYGFLEDGTAVLTFNGLGHMVIGEIPDAVVTDPYAPNLEDQWKAHRTAVAARSAPPVLLDAERFIESSTWLEERYFARLVDDGQVRLRPAEGNFELTLPFALRMCLKVLGGTARSQKLRSSDAGQALAVEAATALVEEETTSFLRHENQRATPSRRLFLVWVFILTGVAFVLVLTPVASPMLIGALAGTIFLHELGHYLAMRVFGYRNATIFFLPFLGAATTGQKRGATLREEVIVLLAGPLPGLLAGFALLALTPSRGGSPAYHLVAWTLIAINLFNLLPVYPLDGGRIVHRLLFSGSAYADTFFKIIAIGLFVFVAVRFGDYPILIIPAVLALALPQGFRTERLRRHLREAREPAAGNEREAARQVFRAFQVHGLGDLPFVRKLHMARELVESLAAPPVATRRKAAWMGLYAICLAGGLGGSLGFFMQSGWWGLLTGGLPSETEVVATVDCSAPASTTPPSPLPADLTLGAVFPTPGAAGAAARQLQDRLGHQAQGTRIGNAILVAAPRANKAVALSALSAAAQALGGKGQFEDDKVMGRFVRTTIRCVARNENSAATLAEEIEDYRRAWQPDLRPPWISARSPADARLQTRARRTYRLLLEELEKAAPPSKDPTASTFARALARAAKGPPSPTKVADAIRRLRAQAGSAAGLDTSLLRAYQGWSTSLADPRCRRTGGAPCADGQLAWRQIRKRLGTASVAGSLAAGTTALIGPASEQVLRGRTVTLHRLVFADLTRGLRPLTRYLCRQTCQELELRFVSRRLKLPWMPSPGR